MFFFDQGLAVPGPGGVEGVAVTVTRCLSLLGRCASAGPHLTSQALATALGLTLATAQEVRNGVVADSCIGLESHKGFVTVYITKERRYLQNRTFLHLHIFKKV